MRPFFLQSCVYKIDAPCASLPFLATFPSRSGKPAWRCPLLGIHGTALTGAWKGDSGITTQLLLMGSYVLSPQQAYPRAPAWGEQGPQTIPRPPHYLPASLAPCGSPDTLNIGTFCFNKSENVPGQLVSARLGSLQKRLQGRWIWKAFERQKAKTTLREVPATRRLVNMHPVCFATVETELNL